MSPTVRARGQEMLDGMQVGDYLLIGFGIDDSSPICTVTAASSSSRLM